VRRGAGYLRDSLTAPSAFIPRGYESVTVVLNDGKTIRGIERALDDFSVVFQDFSGKVYSFDRAAVRLVSRDTESLMPSFESTFSATELGDIVAFLSSLRGPEVTR
jgi:putative heme-binding domain-containing protein